MREMQTFDLRSFFPHDEVKRGSIALRQDASFRKLLKKQKRSLQDAFETTMPLKYIGIERDGARFDFETTVRIALMPRSADDRVKGLRLSVHRKEFLRAFPQIDAALSAHDLTRLANEAELDTKKGFAQSEYAQRVRSALAALQRETGIPRRVSLEVLRKGIAAFHASGHRPGMTAHGWGRARLTAFTFKSCTWYFPDHLLARACPKRTNVFWEKLPCLCHKKEQCERIGAPTPANSGRRA